MFGEGAGTGAYANVPHATGVKAGAFSSPAVQAAAGAILPEGPGTSVYLPEAETGRLPAVLDTLIEPEVKVSPAGIAPARHAPAY